MKSREVARWIRVAVALGAAAYLLWNQRQERTEKAGDTPSGTTSAPSSNSERRPSDSPGVGPAPEGSSTNGVSASTSVAEVFQARRSNVQVEGAGRVEKLLPDDDEGSPHQRFVLDVGSGQTLLVAHNIALADRVPLEVGDSLAFFGEYEWNPKGGVIHWTHDDPQRRHPDGWIRHEGSLYQ